MRFDAEHESCMDRLAANFVTRASQHARVRDLPIRSVGCFCSLIAMWQEDGGLISATVEHEIGSRHFHAREVVQLVGLAKRCEAAQ